MLAALCLVAPLPAAAGFHVPKDDPDRTSCVVCHPATPTRTSVAFGRTEACLSCHDGALGADAMASVPVTVRRVWGMEDADVELVPANPGDHPVGVRYRESDSLNPVEDVRERGLKLYDDGDGPTIACTSCHDPHQNGRASLLRGPQGNLCVSCHSMR